MNDPPDSNFNRNIKTTNATRFIYEYHVKTTANNISTIITNCHHQIN